MKSPQSPILTFEEVFNGFRNISEATGSKSQIEKESIVVGLIQRAMPWEAKYITRWLMGNLKTGAG
jgi:ATP-dependent DNA ligase